MYDCIWENTNKDPLICINCKEPAYNASPNLHRICSKPLKQPNKPLNFLKAVTKFIAISLWKRELQYVNGEQYKERLELCDACNHRHPEKPECIICGCKLKAIFNKAQLKTELCPLGKWPRLYEINPIQVSK